MNWASTPDLKSASATPASRRPEPTHARPSDATAAEGATVRSVLVWIARGCKSTTQAGGAYEPRDRSWRPRPRLADAAIARGRRAGPSHRLLREGRGAAAGAGARLLRFGLLRVGPCLRPLGRAPPRGRAAAGRFPAVGAARHRLFNRRAAGAPLGLPRGAETHRLHAGRRVLRRLVGRRLRRSPRGARLDAGQRRPLCDPLRRGRRDPDGADRRRLRARRQTPRSGA